MIEKTDVSEKFQLSWRIKEAPGYPKCNLFANL